LSRRYKAAWFVVLVDDLDRQLPRLQLRVLPVKDREPQRLVLAELDVAHEADVHVPRRLAGERVDRPIDDVPAEVVRRDDDQGLPRQLAQ
jgi:hypothetical protein